MLYNVYIIYFYLFYVSYNNLISHLRNILLFIKKTNLIMVSVTVTQLFRTNILSRTYQLLIGITIKLQK